MLRIKAPAKWRKKKKTNKKNLSCLTVELKSVSIGVYVVATMNNAKSTTFYIVRLALLKALILPQSMWTRGRVWQVSYLKNVSRIF